ncbi:Hypothetical predicted protein [Octopus vulgaris]|uniref:Integrase p58-like C-terminal domain-containing protein n=1 Tax=Octopus vulgaris TaxID=6645 RepID=A0AA36BD29_OCTVU|nr:Hypothetical predicted protein [Octopus vulgaris]
MKQRYDGKSQKRSFPLDSKVLALLPVLGSSLKARFSGPYKVVKQLNNLDYVIETPDRRKKQQVCHVNMLKPFYERDVESKSFNGNANLLTDALSRS